MAKLVNKTKNIVLSSDLENADSHWKRMKGLLGREGLEDHRALWIKPCSSIHTYFMKFSIDVAFVDRDLKVTRVCQDIKPGKLVFSPLRTHSVFEFNSGNLKQQAIEVGDQLHVDP